MQNQCTIRADVVQLAGRAIAEVEAAVAAGAPTVKCQLLASRFYDALRRELRVSADPAAREKLHAAIIRCERISGIGAKPAVMLSELRAAAALLEHEVATPHARPHLRLIRGGLA